ncbi:hypothetical protein [Actinophytocola sp.]|uniref:hypothetical protein n=1 Tax=Actinophytocola sp. TaxID=1872138 RepID=UPI002D802614|nr:hypothetical protein [Actinophytocola sp.]HET9141348.1 hypothetical protein [Actinophytocola sp.]
MRNRRHWRLAGTAWLSVAGVAVLAGCATGSPAAPGATATSGATPAAGSPAAPVTASLGPDGYGPIKLGMSARDALATGLLGKSQPYIQCTAYPFKGYSDPLAGGKVAINPQFGVVDISAPRDVPAHTPEGIGIGSTEASTRAAYPELAESFNNGYRTAVPGNPGASYLIYFDNGKVNGFGLVSDKDPTCGAS